MLSDDDVREILRIIDTTPLSELRIETEGFALHVLRGAPGSAPQTDPVRAATASPGVPSRPQVPGKSQRQPETETSGDSRAVALSSPEDGQLTIEAPMLGTFYHAESPGSPPFVEVGSRVEPDTTVCIIEVMKMMNSVPAGVGGTVTEICAANGELVEYGAPLFRVEPA